MTFLDRAQAVLGNWLWLCPLLAIGLAAAVLIIWGLSAWTAFVAALLLACPALIVWGAVTLSRNGNQG